MNQLLWRITCWVLWTSQYLLINYTGRSTSAAKLPFLRDDINDLAVQVEVTLLISTADGAKPMREHADAVMMRHGKHRSVHELAERLMLARGLWSKLNREGWPDRKD
jgi:3-deoxy-D-manno-octulosonate 8-phosphate phosphatase KdsC-like HAD superfamily phosphatase